MFLDLLVDYGPMTFRELAGMYYSERENLDSLEPARNCRQWCASADWRGLINRDASNLRIEYDQEVPRYFVTERGMSYFEDLRMGER